MHTIEEMAKKGKNKYLRIIAAVLIKHLYDFNAIGFIPAGFAEGLGLLMFRVVFPSLNVCFAGPVGNGDFARPLSC